MVWKKYTSLVICVYYHFQQYFSSMMAVLLVEKTGVHEENHRPFTGFW